MGGKGRILKSPGLLPQIGIDDRERLLITLCPFASFSTLDLAVDRLKLPRNPETFMRFRFAHGMTISTALEERGKPVA